MTACSSEGKVIRIFEPNFTDESTETNYEIEGARLIHTISDKEEVGNVLQIIENAEEIEEPSSLIGQKPKAIVEIYNNKQNTTEYKRTIWLTTDGIILKNPSGIYSQLSLEQTDSLINSIELE